jgi:hypothetical protein
VRRATAPTAKAAVPSRRRCANGRLGYSAHGSYEMPVWALILQYFENYNEAAVRQRIKNLDYLESIQEK